ncbi:prepilin-type N-terminal cleavage/methylation domain-containing protein [Patescibacteria group bacterium]
MEQLTHNKNSGFALIEVLVTLGITAIIAISFINLVINSHKISRINLNNLKAELYLMEAIEAAKDLESSGWFKLLEVHCDASYSNICHPEINSNEWILVSGAEQLDSGLYNRYIEIEHVYRDSTTNEIVESGGFDHIDTKKVIATITWNQEGEIRSKSLETYVYNPTPPGP